MPATPTGGGHDAYPYNGNDSLTDNSTPAAKLYNPNTDGSNLMHKSITEITRDEQTGFVSFLFKNENNANSALGIQQLLKADEVVDVYTLDGAAVLRNATAENAYALRPGTYVVRSQSGHSRKIVVK